MPLADSLAQEPGDPGIVGIDTGMEAYPSLCSPSRFSLVF
jgi:hypothetical protein